MEQFRPASSTTIAVTGTTGYIGRAVVDRLVRGGSPVVALSRKPPPSGEPWKKYDLTQPLAAGDLDGIGAVIHLAAETHRGPLANSEVEVAAAKRLLDACRTQNARVIFVSSQTAQEDAATDYGRSKWRCERLVLAAGGVVVRPGQVYGGPEEGLFGLLCRIVRTSPVIPRFIPEPVVQPVHVDDLAQALVACATQNGLSSGIYSIAQVQPVGFSTFLRMLAQLRFNRYLVRLPVPTGAIGVLATMPFLPQALRGSAQRLQSLVTLPVMETSESMTALNIRLRPLREGLVRSRNGRRRLLLVEARTLLVYVLRGQAPSECIKHYVRAVEALHRGEPLLVRPVFQRWPGLLSIVDQPLARRRDATAPFWARLHLAAVCAEASVATVDRFLVLDDDHRLARLLTLGIRLAAEACRQLLGAGLGFAVNHLRPSIENNVRAR